MASIMVRRHGDVMIKTKRGFQIPENVALARTTQLHKGNNHDHFFASGHALVGESGGKKYLRVVESAVIDHVEHGKGDVPIGDYYVELKSEYDHWAEESRAVAD